MSKVKLSKAPENPTKFKVQIVFNLFFYPQSCTDSLKKQRVIISLDYKKIL